MKKTKIMLSVCLLLMMTLFSGVIYAADNEAGENVTEQTYTKNDKNYKCLASVSDDGYLKITQIVPTSQNVKISTYVDDNKLLISGVVNKDTEVIIKVYNDEEEFDYTLTSTGTFSQSMEIPEGENIIIVSYSNEKDGIEDYIKFVVTRASAESINAIKSFLVTA